MAGFPLEVQRGLRLALDAERQGLLSPDRLDAILRYYDQEGGVYPAPAPEVLEKLGGLTATQIAHLLGLRPPGFQPRELTPRLLLLEPLGEGGMGTVYKAQDRVLRRVVAVKLIKTERLGSSQALQRFEREALVMARVVHPACVPIYEAGVAEDQPYLVMKLIPGRSLKDVLIEHPLGVDPRRVARWGQRLADGLQACHEAGVIHRDVKPANVLLDEQDQPLLTDFGVALDGEARTRLTLASGAVGTLAYMPPEQAGGEVADHRSDLYALGATMYEALTGRLPLEADQPLVLVRKIAEERPRPLREYRGEVPLDLERVVLACLEKSKDDRYPSAQALGLDLARFLAGEAVSARPVGALGRSWRWTKRHRIALSRVLIAGLVITLGWTMLEARTQRTARQKAAREIGAAVAAASSRAEERLVQLSAAPDSWIATESRKALNSLRARARLATAQAGLHRLEELSGREAYIADRIRALEAGLDERLPVTASTPKQERLRLVAEREALPLQRSQAVTGVLLALDQAAAYGGDGAEVGALRARLLERMAREAPPDEAETLFLRALEADRQGGGRLAPALALARIEIAVDVPCPIVIHNISYSEGEGVMRSVSTIRSFAPCVVQLASGEYVLEARLPGRMHYRDTLALRRGDRRRYPLTLMPNRNLGPLAEELVWIPGGHARGGSSRLGEVAGFGVLRTELTVEAWRSLWLFTGRSAALVPTGLSPGLGVGVLTESRWRAHPICGVSQPESLRMCAHLQVELDLAAVLMTVDLPTVREFHRSVRGEFDWHFPWGRRFDPGLCACSPSVQGAGQPCGAPATDVSPFTVLGLAGNVSEWGDSKPDGEAYQFGGSCASAQRDLEVLLGGYGTTPPLAEPPDVGMRYVLRPALWPREVPHPDPSVNWIQVALRAMAAKDVGPALQAARNHVAVKPREAWRWVDRARVQLQIGDTWGAWFSATQATLLKPEWGEAWHVLGQVQQVRENAAEAVRACDRCVELDPDYRLAYYTRGAARSFLADVVGGVADATVFLGRSERALPPDHREVQLGREVLVGLMQRLAREAAVGAASR